MIQTKETHIEPPRELITKIDTTTFKAERSRKPNMIVTKADPLRFVILILPDSFIQIFKRSILSRKREQG